MATSKCESIIVGNSSASSTVAVAMDSASHATWKRCVVCRLRSDGSEADPGPFRTPRDFCRHLREYHCTREGGSFVCRYGLNGVCPSLPVDGVSDRDYEDHVARDHVVTNELNLVSTKTVADLKTSSASSMRSLVSRDSNLESLASAPSIVKDQHQWTVFMSRVNLPAVLNDPTLSRREVDIFSKTWGESFERAEVRPSSHLPHITPNDFSKYLARTSTRYKKHVKFSSAVPAAAIAAENGVTSQKEFPAVYVRKMGKKCAELDSVPKIFQQPGFSLQNPDTFNAVFPWHQVAVSRHEQGTKSRQSAKLLQEKLSHYLDVVEIQIAEQISHRSEAFFDAMTSHDELQDHMRRTCDVIRYLREQVRNLNRIHVQNPMRIMQLTLSHSNHVQVYEKLKLMATVHQTQPTIQLLLSTNDYVGALDLISTTQDVLMQELFGIQSFRHLGPQLAELEKMIDQMMQEEFFRFAAHDLNRPADEHRSQTDEERLVMIVLGALRQHKYYFIDIYREEAITTLKAVVKQTVIEAVAAADDIDTDSNAASLANQMRLLNYTQWMSLLGHLFERLIVVVRRVQSMTIIVHEIVRASSEHDIVTDGSPQLSSQYATNATGTHEESIESINTVEPAWREAVQHTTSFPEDAEQILSQGEYLRVTGLLHEMLIQVCEQAHDRSLKVLIARSKDCFFEKLALGEFVQLTQAVEAFTATTEHISGRRSASLRATMQSQASKYVSRFHEERKNKLTLILDNERWKQADVPAEFQDLVDHIAINGQLCLPAKKLDIDRPLSEFLVVSGEQFAVVGTMLMLLKIVVEYCQIITDIPSVAPEVLNRLVELLKMFNSRSCQLILGAGAVHLVGLKTISTKNLGLSSRCLQLVVHYLPIFQQHFEQRLTGTQLNMLKHFDHLAKDYNDHIAEIANKLIAITDSMLEINLNKWEVKAPMPSTCFRNVIRQISKLHEAVNGLLPESQIQELFQRVHSSFKNVLRTQLKKLCLARDGGPQHGLVMADLAFYSTSMRAMLGLSGLDVNCDDVWEKKT